MAKIDTLDKIILVGLNVWVFSTNVHSERIFGWMGTKTKVTLVSDIFEVVTFNMREQISLKRCSIVTIHTSPR